MYYRLVFKIELVIPFERLLGGRVPRYLGTSIRHSVGWKKDMKANVYKHIQYTHTQVVYAAAISPRPWLCKPRELSNPSPLIISSQII